MDDQDQENYCIIKSNKSSIRNSQNLFVNQGIKHLKNPKAIFSDNWKHENLEDYMLGKQWKVLIVFVDVIPVLESNKNLKPLVA